MQWRIKEHFAAKCDVIFDAGLNTAEGATCVQPGNEKGATQNVAPRFTGAGERNRTSDLRVTSALLYQLSYSSKDRRNYRGHAILGATALMLRRTAPRVRAASGIHPPAAAALHP
jgi:hypothetical protein